MFHRRESFEGPCRYGNAVGGVARQSGFGLGTKDEIIEGARERGRVPLVRPLRPRGRPSHSRRIPEARAISQKLEYVEVPAAQKQARFIQECLAGGPTSDIMITSAAALQQLTDRKFLHEVDWDASALPGRRSRRPTAT